MKRPRIQAIVLAIALALTPPVTRSASCGVSTSGLSFGNYDVFSTLNDDVTGTISVNCTSGAPYSISLSSGFGIYAARAMTNAGNTLAYNLYLDPTRLTIWGDGSAGTGIFNGTGTGASVGTTVYGRIPAKQNVPVGNYMDTITITVTF